MYADTSAVKGTRLYGTTGSFLLLFSLVDLLLVLSENLLLSFLSLDEGDSDSFSGSLVLPASARLADSYRAGRMSWNVSAECFFCRWTTALAACARLLLLVDVQIQPQSMTFLNRCTTQHERRRSISYLPSSGDTGAGRVTSTSFTASTACKAKIALAQVNLANNDWPLKQMQQLVASGSHLKEVHPARNPIAVQMQK